jgi:hypothetical protein
MNISYALAMMAPEIADACNRLRGREYEALRCQTAPLSSLWPIYLLAVLCSPVFVAVTYAADPPESPFVLQIARSEFFAGRQALPPFESQNFAFRPNKADRLVGTFTDSSGKSYEYDIGVRAKLGKTVILMNLKSQEDVTGKRPPRHLQFTLATTRIFMYPVWNDGTWFYATPFDHHRFTTIASPLVIAESDLHFHKPKLLASRYLFSPYELRTEKYVSEKETYRTVFLNNAHLYLQDLILRTYNEILGQQADAKSFRVSVVFSDGDSYETFREKLTGKVSESDAVRLFELETKISAFKKYSETADNLTTFTKEYFTLLRALGGFPIIEIKTDDLCANILSLANSFRWIRDRFQDL